MIGDKVHRLPDLPLTRLAVADDAVDRLVKLIQPSGRASPPTERPCPSGASRGIEKRETESGLGWPSIGLPMLRKAMRSSMSWTRVTTWRDRHPEIGTGRIDDRYGMTFGENQPILNRPHPARRSHRMTRYISTAIRCASERAVVGWPLPAEVVPEGPTCQVRSLSPARLDRGSCVRSPPAVRAGDAAAGLREEPPLFAEGVTAPSGMTLAPAFSNCSSTDFTRSSQLWAKDAMPCRSSTSATSAKSTPTLARLSTTLWHPHSGS